MEPNDNKDLFSYKNMRKSLDKTRNQLKDQEKRREEDRINTMKSKGVNPTTPMKVPKKRCDHPNTIEDSTATVFWLIAMAISILFKGGWMLCIVETAIWLQFILRYD